MVPGDQVLNRDRGSSTRRERRATVDLPRNPSSLARRELVPGDRFSSITGAKRSCLESGDWCQAIKP
jgi:hypothetical protein